MTFRRSRGTTAPPRHVRRHVAGVHAFVLLVAALGLLPAACARPMQEWDDMSGLAVCDSIPRPIDPGEPVGATLPAGVRPSAESGTVIGTVTEAGSGRTMRAATVTFHTLPERSDSNARPARGARTSATGGFEVRSLVPGSYRIRVSAIGHRPRDQRIDVHAGAVDTLAVQLPVHRCTG